MDTTKFHLFGATFYAFVIVDDFSHFTWVHFLTHKSESSNVFKSFVNKTQNELGTNLIKVRSDEGGEFFNSDFENFCNDFGITHQLSAARTPQQNGVSERKNRTLIEMGRTMLNEYDLPKYFWAEEFSTACYISNRVLLKK